MQRLSSVYRLSGIHFGWLQGYVLCKQERKGIDGEDLEKERGIQFGTSHDSKRSESIRLNMCQAGVTLPYPQPGISKYPNHASRR